MKLLAKLSFLLLFPFSLTAQDFQWAKSFGGSVMDVLNSVTTDPSGNVYTAGFFETFLDANPGTSSDFIISEGYFDICIYKFDASGNFIWAKSIGADQGDVANTIKYHPDGYLLITGGYGGGLDTADFDPGPGEFNLPTTGGEFFLKLDLDGNFIDAKNTSFGYNVSSAIDNDGNLFLSGEFYGTEDFDPDAGVYNLTSAGQDDAYITKLDPSGMFIWSRRVGGLNDEEIEEILVDTAGNVLLVGSYEGTCDFDPGAAVYNLTSAGQTDGFMLKLDGNGDFLWAKSIGGASNDACTRVVCSAAGTIFVGGFFSGNGRSRPGSRCNKFCLSWSF